MDKNVQKKIVRMDQGRGVGEEVKVFETVAIGWAIINRFISGPKSVLVGYHLFTCILFVVAAEKLSAVNTEECTFTAVLVVPLHLYNFILNTEINIFDFWGKELCLGMITNVYMHCCIENNTFIWRGLSLVRNTLCCYILLKFIYYNI